jgi:hypothetical protein
MDVLLYRWLAEVAYSGGDPLGVLHFSEGTPIGALFGGFLLVNLLALIGLLVVCLRKPGESWKKVEQRL